MKESDITAAKKAYDHVFEVLLAASVADKAANDKKAASTATVAKANTDFEALAQAARAAADAKIAEARAILKKAQAQDEEVVRAQDAAIAAAKATLAEEKAKFEAQYGQGFFPGAATGGARTRI